MRDKNNVMRILKFCLFFMSVLSIAVVNKGVGQSSSKWKVQATTIQTHWTKLVDPTSVLPEYPRPQMERINGWKSLNGLWNYTVTSKDVNVPPTQYAGEILVPYPLEAALSGVHKSLLPNQLLWYKRNFRQTIRKDERLLLHFGAVDYDAKIWVNGKEVGAHEGGYSPFSFDITEFLRSEDNELIVRVYDPTDQGYGPHGKQTLDPANIYYTACSGIWQTVWIERVPSVYIQEFKLVPNIDKQELIAEIAAPLGYDIELAAMIGKMKISSAKGKSGSPITLSIPRPQLWSPNNPFLYDLKIKLLKEGKLLDEVGSYFGMRKVSIQKDERGLDRIFLNNEPYFNLGVLDQGYWPDGLYTAPTDEALRFDIEVIKEMGFNTIRKHVKVESARWYYHADRLGMMVWQDFVNPNQNLPKESKPAFEREAKATIDQLHNSPSVITWVIFNEKWGQYDQMRLTEWVKKYDTSRIVNGHSGELLYVDDKLRSPSPNAYVSSDITDVHSYPFPKMTSIENGKARVVGEFGGIGLSIPGHQWNDMMGWGYLQVSPEDFGLKYSELVDQIVELKEGGLSASIYTQPFDVEVEENGLLTYDRKIAKIPIGELRRLNSRIFEVVRANSRFDSRKISNISSFFSKKKYSQENYQLANSNLDSASLREMIKTAYLKRDSTLTNQLAIRYWGMIEDKFNPNNLNLFRQITTSTDDIGFRFLLREEDHVNRILGVSGVGDLLKQLIDAEIRPLVFKKDRVPDFDSLEKVVVERYMSEGEIVLWTNMAVFYNLKKDYINWYRIKLKLYTKYPNAISTFDLNNDAWCIFQNLAERDMLETALSWSKNVIDIEPTANYYDTYANILYKLGRTKDAIDVEKMALELTPGNGSIEDVKRNLKLMIDGEPTWK